VSRHLHPRALTLPGWLGSGPAHWQSRWEAAHGFTRVEQDDWQWPRRGDWMARLEESLLTSATPALLVAHSLGCHLVAAWAEHSRHTARVCGALLVAPPDTQRADTPPQLHSWRQIPCRPLPFPALVVASSDDPFCALERARAFAADWGAACQFAGPHGHLNGDSGLGDWPEGLALLRTLGLAAVSPSVTAPAAFGAAPTADRSPSASSVARRSCSAGSAQASREPGLTPKET
jgi:predicted alpha/beta hydrolase family esterase